jgi:hypothetical protein
MPFPSTDLIGDPSGRFRWPWCAASRAEAPLRLWGRLVERFGEESI